MLGKPVEELEQVQGTTAEGLEVAPEPVLGTLVEVLGLGPEPEPEPGKPLGVLGRVLGRLVEGRVLGRQVEVLVPGTPLEVPELALGRRV